MGVIRRFVLSPLSFWQKDVSLTFKALLLTVAVGVIFWSILNHSQSEAQKKIFNDYLMGELAKRSYSDWGRFDDHMREQTQAAKLFVDRMAFHRYIEAKEASHWATDEVVKVQTLVSGHPSWLPSRSVLRGLVRVAYVLLLDPKGRVREVYPTGRHRLPADLMTGLVDDMVGSSDNRNRIRESGGQAFLFTRVALLDEREQSRAFLVLVTAFDDDFLVSMQLQNKSEGILIFLGQDGTKVVASSQPDLVPAGTPIKNLEETYRIMEKSYFDYGFSSDLFIQFATLISVARINELNATISRSGRTRRAVVHILMNAMTILIVIWLVRRIRQFTQEMIVFSRERLGLESPEIERGDQLAAMRQQFRRMADEIIAARAREKEHKEELQEANKALWESLVMIKRTQAQLVESEKLAALGGLVAGVAHEINTPVGIGMTAASFLQRRCGETARRMADGTLKKSELELYFEEAVESSDMILSNLNRAAELIRSFKQIAVDQASEDRRVIRLKQYVEQLLVSLHHRLKRTQHTVTLVCPDELEYDGYPGFLSQILTNFIENSLIHGFSEKEKGHIVMEISPVGDQIILRYTDDGRGMNEDDRRRIFDPFFTTARGQGGSGLGMHIVYNLVTQHLGGTIDCRSAPLQGIAFTLTIPAVLQEKRNAEGKEGQDG